MRKRQRVMWRLARLRVALGFASGAVVFWLARPDCRSLAAGGAIAVAGELVRLWASGHLDKAREVTSSGPYRFLAHPLYAGSTIMAAGLAVAARSVPAAILVATYLLVTITSAIRTEEAVLRFKFGDAYGAYRESRAAASTRPFALARVVKNREHRAVAGLAIALLLLVWKAGCW